MIKKILHFRTVTFLSLSSVALSLFGASWVYSSLIMSGSGPFILHFNDMTGITSVGDAGSIVFMGVLGFVVTLMNFFIALELEERDPLLGKLMAGGTFIFAILLFISFAAILNVNA